MDSRLDVELESIEGLSDGVAPVADGVVRWQNRELAVGYEFSRHGDEDAVLVRVNGHLAVPGRGRWSVGPAVADAQWEVVSKSGGALGMEREDATLECDGRPYYSADTFGDLLRAHFAGLETECLVDAFERELDAVVAAVENPGA